MSKCRKFVCLSAAAVLLLSACPSGAADKKQEQKSKTVSGLLIKHYAWLLGDADIAVSPAGISIAGQHSSAVTVSKAPFKTIVCYDRLRKTYYETKPEAGSSFLVQRYMRMVGSAPHPAQWKKVETGVIAGMKAGRYVAAAPVLPTSADRFDKSEKSLFDMRVNGFWVAEDPAIPAGAADVVLKMEGFPMIHKLPLRFTMSTKKSADKTTRVDTYSIKKTIFPADQFEVPHGFRKIEAEYSLQGDEMELFEGGDRAALKRKR